MIGWILAAVILLVAVFVYWRLNKQLTAVRASLEQTRAALHGVQEELEKRKLEAVFGRVLSDVAPKLVARQGAGADDPMTQMDEILDDYGKRVDAYDKAVQRCLKPVELMPGANEDDLEKLMGHVTASRRGLFQARNELLENDLRTLLPPLFGADEEQDDEEPRDILAAALRLVTGTVSGGQSNDLARLLSAILVIAQARHPAGPELAVEVGELAGAPSAPWLAPCLIELLQLGMRGSSSSAPAMFSARHMAGQLVIEFSGASEYADGSPEGKKLKAAAEDVRAFLDEHGVELQLQHDGVRRHSFMLVMTSNTSPEAPVDGVAAA